MRQVIRVQPIHRRGRHSRSLDQPASASFRVVAASAAESTSRMYSPLPHERAAYQMYWQHADVSHSGAIGGQDAVGFFSKSGLDMLVLKQVRARSSDASASLRARPSVFPSQVWDLSVATSANKSALSAAEFFVALRLIAMAQQEHPLTYDSMRALASTPLPLPRFHGIPEPPVASAPPASVVPASPPSGVSAVSPPAAATGAEPFALTQPEYERYRGLFATVDPNGDGLVEGADAVPLFSKSGLDRGALGQIWQIADVDKDAKLSLNEFVSAMHISTRIRAPRLSLSHSLSPLILGF